MNKIIGPSLEKAEDLVPVGSIICLKNGDYYILSLVDCDTRCLISLKDGNRYCGSVTRKSCFSNLTVDNLIEDFELTPPVKIFSQCEITIKEIKA